VGVAKATSSAGPGRQAEELAAWVELDLARALHPADRAAIRATDSARWLVLDLLRGGHARDLFNACARLGTLLAEAGASPTLAAATIDGAADSLQHAGVSFDANRVPAARASLLEGYVATVREAERALGLARWEYAGCVVRIDDGAASVACGHPADDPEALGAWAERVASRLLKARFRRVILGGDEVAKGALAEALAFVGIEVGPPPAARDTSPPQSDDPAEDEKKGRSWFRLPWKR
jgi:hypothetical protein